MVLVPWQACRAPDCGLWGKAKLSFLRPWVVLLPLFDCARLHEFQELRCLFGGMRRPISMEWLTALSRASSSGCSSWDTWQNLVGHWSSVGHLMWRLFICVTLVCAYPLYSFSNRSSVLGSLLWRSIAPVYWPSDQSRVVYWYARWWLSPLWAMFVHMIGQTRRLLGSCRSFLWIRLWGR